MYAISYIYIYIYMCVCVCVCVFIYIYHNIIYIYIDAMMLSSSGRRVRAREPTCMVGSGSAAILAIVSAVLVGSCAHELCVCVLFF
jgi:predicted cation transporter